MVGQLDAESRRAARQFGSSRDKADVGFTPVIATIPEGVMLSAMAVVSGDRRYVRITPNPLFSNITDVFTFTFAGNTAGNQNQGNQGGGIGGMGN
jgi:general secretion pathway protein D